MTITPEKVYDSLNVVDGRPTQEGTVPCTRETMVVSDANQKPQQTLLGTIRSSLFLLVVVFQIQRGVKLFLCPIQMLDILATSEIFTLIRLSSPLPHTSQKPIQHQTPPIAL